MTVGPKSISLGNDRSCQLKCWICRENHIIDNDPCIVAAQKLILDEFLPTAEQLSFSHAGDPFISAADRQLLDLNWDRYPNLKIELFTNGLLLASNWTSLKCRPLIHRVMISMDAGTQQTYQMVRGGDWHRLLNGLSVIANEKVIRPIDLWLNMTVYSKNWRDIPAFIDLGKKFGADRIELKAFLPLWHTTYQYQSANVCDSNHPDHAELLQLIERNREALDSVDSKQLLAACGVL
jgi:wyosine [tRNA(Phe)-imidazoG37] synthetase (radical SAM superfamily)